MSQLETIMWVFAGFAVASLIALVLGKFAWNIAYRLGARRARKQIPSNLIELQVEKDRLRAENAMLHSRSEVEADQLKSREVEQMAEVMRNRNRIGTLGEAIALRDQQVATHAAEIAALKEQIEVIEAELARRTETIQSLEAKLQQRAAAPVAEPQPAAVPVPYQPVTLEREAEPELLPFRLSALRQAPAAESANEDEAAAQDRLSKRVRDLTRIADQFRNREAPLPADRSRIPEIKPSPVDIPPMPASSFEPRIDPAALKNGDFSQGVMRQQDEYWQEPETAGPEPEILPPQPSETQPRLSPSVANVISLAQRLRALKKDVNS